MKKILAIVKATVLIMPCLLVCNESETLVPNLIGIAYIGCLILYSRTAAGIKMWRKLYKYSGHTPKKRRTNMKQIKQIAKNTQ